MKYRIEPITNMTACIWTHLVKCKGHIVFRGTEQQCKDWCQDALQADRYIASDR